jgi:hypothetical protein
VSKSTLRARMQLRPILVLNHIRRDAVKSLAFPISYFPICSTTERIFLGWVKEIITTKP